MPSRDDETGDVGETIKVISHDGPQSFLCMPVASLVDGNRQKVTLRSMPSTSEPFTARLFDSITAGPPLHPSLQYYSSAHQDRLKFKTFAGIDFNGSIDDRYENWDRLFNLVASSSENTERWDDVWYWTSTPLNKWIVMMACDLDAGTYAAVSLYNGESQWAVFRSNSNPDPVRIYNGYDRKLKLPYNIGGSVVEFDLWNPEGGDWGINDMIVSWGRP